MKKRIVSFLLALVMAASCVPTALAAGGGRMAVAVSTAGGVVIAPQYVDCAQGETVWQVLSRMEGHTFTQGADGFVTSIDGVVANYSRFDSSGGYDLESSAAEAGAFVFTDTEIKDMSGYCDMVCAMADYNGADVPVRRYAEAEYAAAESGLSSGTADYAALAQTLREKMAAYEKEVIGADKVTAVLAVTDLDGGALTGYTVTVENAYGTESVFQAGEPVQLAAGEYTFRVEAGHSGARGTMTLETDGTVRIAGKAVTALAVPAGKEWLKAPILHRTTGKLEGDAYTSEAGGGHAAVYYVPDAVSGSYLYCVPGSDLTESGTYSTAAVRPVGYYTDIHGAERVKTGMPWQSMAASLAELLTASDAGNTVRVEAQYTGGGYTAYQWFDMTVVRTPTLAALEVTVQGVAQSIGFAPERETYELSVTADKLVITPTAFASGYTVTVNGQETQSGTAVTMPVNAEGSEIAVAVSGGGRSRTYTLAVQRVAAVDVTVRHDSGVTVHVFNSAHAEIGAAEQGSGFDRFALVPGESYTYVTDKQTWYHAAGDFTAAEGLTVDAQTPDTADALDSLYLATKGTKIQSNDQVCLAVPAHAKHAYAFSVADYSSSLYCWAKAEGYTFTAVETGKNITPKAATLTGQHLTGLLKTGDATQTLTIRASRNGEGVTFYQDYVITIYRTPTLTDKTGLSLAAEGADVPIAYKTASGEATGFDRSVTEYSATIPRSAESVTVTLKPFGKTYGLYVNGTRHALPVDSETGVQADTVSVEIPLNSQKDSESVSITPVSRQMPAAAQRRNYQLTLNKKEAVPTAFRVTDGSGNTVRDALVCVYDGRTQARIWPESDGTFALVDTLPYTYVVTCRGYVGVSGSFTADAKKREIAVSMKKPPESSHGAGITSDWSSFRGSDTSNGVVADKTPITAESAVLSWASKLGDGYSSGAVGCPITITEGGYDYLIVYAADKLYKVDALSGVTVAVGQMDHSSSFAINSPTYAEGMIFVGLSNGAVQAFDAATLESLWIYRDRLGGQPNCPITYHDGYIYTGFWNSEVAQANLVCLSVTDEDPAQTTEDKLAAWTYASAGGFYWAGAYVCSDYLLIGTDDGDSSCISETSALLCIDPADGRLMDSITGLRGDIRCNIARDGERFYFTSKGGYFYSVAAPEKSGGDWLLDDGSLRAVALENGGDAAHPAMSTCTPVVYNGRAYIGVSGTGQFTPYSGHNITVIDLTGWRIAYSVPTQGYPQTSGLLTTAYGAEDGTVYVYFFDNYTPGKLRVLKDAPGRTRAMLTTEESYTVKGVTNTYTTPYVLFTPADAQAQYAICSPITDSYGTLYFKNDSAHLMALSSTIESLTISKLPDKTAYKAGEVFDPTGMEITITYENGLTRTLPAERTMNGTAIRYAAWNEEPLKVSDGEGFLIRFAHSLYQDGADGAGTNVNSPAAVLDITVEPAMAGDLDGNGKRNAVDMQNLFTYLSTGVMEGALGGDEEAYRAAADVNGDGAVDILDYQALYTTIREEEEAA